MTLHGFLVGLARVLIYTIEGGLMFSGLLFWILVYRTGRRLRTKDRSR